MIVLIVVTVLLFLVTCDFIRELFPTGKSDLTFKASFSLKTNKSDTVLFTGNDIKWLNGTTGEIRFVNSSMIPKIKAYHFIKCYLGPDSIVTARVTLPVVSALINDLVLNMNLNDGQFYFEDGYPDWIENPEAKAIRNKLKAKREPAWNRIMEELKREGKYVEK
jgi:hypothetical protein